MNDLSSHLWDGLDYWTACERGLVAAPERRAMGLLRQLCDEYRANVYCATGSLAAMGNITGKTYIINRRFGIDELYDGEVVFNYCIAINDVRVPRTDSVIVMKQMIEGEELEFRKLANRFGPHMSPGRVRGFSNPFLSTLLDRESKKALNHSHFADDHLEWLRSMIPHKSDKWEYTPERRREVARLTAEAIEDANAFALEQPDRQPCAGGAHLGLPWI